MALVTPAVVLGLLVLWIGSFHVHNPLMLVPVGLLMVGIPVFFVSELFAVRAALLGGIDGVFPRTPVNIVFLACGMLVMIACGGAMMWYVLR